ncbi:MAG: 50S ribosomal protein L23 [Candidatus Diapherotrites archaeon]|jgi:ribosomal protein L23|uniref:Large ribosomal subunit protein uL23 n=1 Tax=Candidatus Iainarchaeum sp. TaxID=3101447 RepID=A0A7K4BY80_9ARCH|nr:50S ribosomal protein L23 [Candidatus Diapherotrites archaeon]
MVKLTKTDKIQQKAETAKKTETEKTKETKPTKKEIIETTATIKDLEIVLYPLVTEKAVNMIDSENKITFIVNKNTNKKKVKEIIERVYNVKVDKINMVRDMKGRKKAIVKLKKEFKANDLATKLKIL